jgi:hypothetical protein
MASTENMRNHIINSTPSVRPDLQRMAAQVKEILPAVPLSVITKDLGTDSTSCLRPSDSKRLHFRQDTQYRHYSNEYIGRRSPLHARRSRRVADYGDCDAGSFENAATFASTAHRRCDFSAQRPRPTAQLPGEKSSTHRSGSS